ncbi:MAG: hypothetical protein HQL72_02575 [Magnetococcales bacterium]|nr:hypothetical protein [Magnetococcales bacterium]
MMSGPQPPRSQLAQMQGVTINAEGTKVFGWNHHGILVISVDDNRLSWPERELIRNLGDRLYGRGRCRGGHHG